MEKVQLKKNEQKLFKNNSTPSGGTVSQLMMNSSLMQQKSQQQNSSFGSTTVQRLSFTDILGTGINASGLGQAGVSAMNSGNNIINPFMTSSQRLLNTTTRALAHNRTGKGLGYLGMGLSAYNLWSANNNSDRVQAGADLGAGALGTFGGPLGGAFSLGYAGGQLLDQAVEGATGRSLSDRGGDALYDTFGTAPQWMMDMF